MPKPLGTDNQHKSSGHHDRKNILPDKTRVYAVRKTDLELPDSAPEEPDQSDSDSEDAYDEGYYVAMVHAAGKIDRTWGRCYNCAEEGHQWRNCTKQLKDSLRKAKE